jgi:hypothetical protein
MEHSIRTYCGRSFRNNSGTSAPCAKRRGSLGKSGKSVSCVKNNMGLHQMPVVVCPLAKSRSCPERYSKRLMSGPDSCGPLYASKARDLGRYKAFPHEFRGLFDLVMKELQTQHLFGPA